ncbi:MAG: hypothetical protein H6Q89_4601, partial [Myxococcaceae bacterium]|nr:hypothetical protein [Myxococcaceae bacterium]
SESFKDPATSSVSGTTHRLTLSPGRYLWRVTARDAAGHPSFSSEPRSFVVADAPTPSKVSVLYPIDGAVLVRPADGLLGIAWSKVEHAVSHELELDGVVQAVGMPPTRVPLPEGDHVVRVRAIGARGKSSEWSPAVRFYFGSPRVVSASVAFDREPLRSDGASTSRVEIRLLDARGNVVPGAKPELSVDHGSLAGLHQEGESWVAQWQAPAELPPSQAGTLWVREGPYQGQHTLRLAGDFSPLTLAGVVGGRYNGGAVRSPAGALTLAYRPYLAGGRLTAHLRAGIYGAAATVNSPDGPVAARVTAPSVSLLVGGHLNFGQWTLLGVVGGGVQVAASSVGVATQTAALPAFEVVAALGRRLGPGAVEVELSFLYSRLNIPLARLQAGGLFFGIGYRFDLSGGK